jgi:hypothetical protein
LTNKVKEKIEMIDQTIARIRAHHSNIDRYRRLLQTQLTELERGFVERRLGEEQSAFAALTEAALPPKRKAACRGVGGPHQSSVNHKNRQDRRARF